MFLTNLSWLNLISLFSSVSLQIVFLFSWEMKLSWQWFIIPSPPSPSPSSSPVHPLPFSSHTRASVCGWCHSLGPYAEISVHTFLSCCFLFWFGFFLVSLFLVFLWCGNLPSPSKPLTPELPWGMESCCFPSRVVTFDHFTLSQTASGSLLNFRIQNTIAF